MAETRRGAASGDNERELGQSLQRRRMWTVRGWDLHKLDIFLYILDTGRHTNILSRGTGKGGAVTPPETSVSATMEDGAGGRRPPCKHNEC